MNYKQAPSVLSTTPANGSTEVPTSMLISVRFSVDLDANSIAGNFRLLDADGLAVEGDIRYLDRVITFRPRQPLAPGALYRIVLVGDEEPEDAVVTGLRSVLGVPMLGSKEYSFTTAGMPTLPAPVFTWPKDGSSLSQAADFFFEWKPVDGAKAYHLEISRSNRFDPVVYPPETQPHTTSTRVVPGEYGDGLFYARVRAIGADDQPSPWSPILSVFLDRAEVATAVPEDTAPVDPVDGGIPRDNYGLQAAVSETYPTADWGNVALNLRCIRFVIEGLPAGTTAEDLQAKITPETVRIEGTSVDPGDEEIVEHGVIDHFEAVEVRPLSEDRFEVIITLPEWSE